MIRQFITDVANAVFPQHSKTSAVTPRSVEETVGPSRENAPLLRVRGTDQPTSELLRDAAEGLHLYAPRTERLAELRAELRDRAAQFEAIED